MKIIFLDIDGVLNSIDSMVAFSKKGQVDKLDAVSIGLLQKLCVDTQAKIVISSTWRLGRSVKSFLDIFAQYGWMDAPVIDKTEWRVSESCGQDTRGHQIKEWLDRHIVSNFVILDDDSDMLPEQLNNFVHISNVNGFRTQHYCKALRVLGQPDDELEWQANFKIKLPIGVQYDKAKED